MARWIGFILGILGFAACATTTGKEQCLHRADEAYRLCQNPYRMPNSDPREEVRGEAAESCRLAHQQAIAECGETPSNEPPPVIDLSPDAGVGPAPGSSPEGGG